jgi:flagellin-like hook-associated protein FlgL
MASNITLSAGVRQNLLSLQSTADLMSTTQNRLATGKKVNSALDNPTNFFTSQALNSRAGDMSSLLDNMTAGIKTLEAADNGLSAITKTVESMQSTLRQARQDKSFKTESYTIDATTIGTSTAKTLTLSGGAIGTTGVDIDLNTVAGTATPTTITGAGADFTALAGGVIDINGTSATIRGDATLAAASVTGAGSTDISTDPDFSLLTGQVITLTAENGTDETSYTFTGSATGQGAAMETALEAEGFTIARTATGLNITRADGNNFTVDTGNAAVATALGLTNGATTTNGVEAFDATATTVAADINAAVAGLATVAGGEINLSLASGADLAITSSVAGLVADMGFGAGTSTNGAPAGNSVKTVDELVSDINSDTALTGKVRASNDSGKLRIENLSTADLDVRGVNSGAVDGSTSTSDIGGNTVRSNLVKQFNELRDQLNKLADDASFNGVNLLRGDLLKLTFNETGTSTIEIQAKDESGQERPINTDTLGIVMAEDSDFDSDDGIDTMLDGLQAALGTLRSQASSFGSNLSIVENRTDFSKAMINTLQTGADSLVLADTNEEAANMLALQTRQQLSSTALSMASQADQAVLRLF